MTLFLVADLTGCQVEEAVQTVVQYLSVFDHVYGFHVSTQVYAEACR